MNRTRVERWNSTPQKTWSQQGQEPHSENASNKWVDKSSAVLDAVANSRVISGINAAGDWLSNTSVMKAMYELNPIIAGSKLLDESIQSFKQGNVLNAAAGTGLALLSAIPGEALALEGIAGARYLSSRLSMFGGRSVGVERSWQSAEKAFESLEGTQAKNLKRFIDKLPQNSENVRVRDFLNGGKVFQADSPASNIPGSFARYEKQIDVSGNTVLYTKTTFGQNGEIVHVAPKFPAGSKIYPEPDIVLRPRPN